MFRQFLFVLTLMFPLLSTALTSAEEAADGAAKTVPVNYVDDVLPIIRNRCGSCHNANDRKGGLVLDQYAAAMEGGSSGPSIEPGDPENSYLWNLVTHESQPAMPPNADKLPAEELAIIEKWIHGGALEHSGSRATPRQRPALDKVDVSSERPDNIAIPSDYYGEPLVVSSRANAVTALAASPWAPLLAVSGHHQVAVYQTRTLEPLGVLPFPEGQPHVLTFSRDGELLLAAGGRGGASGRVVVYDVRTGERRVELGEEYDQILAADISPDRALIALGGPKRILRVYSANTGEKLYETDKHTDWVTAVAFSPDGKLLASADRSNGLCVWEADGGEILHDLGGHKGPITSVRWRGDSRILASASEDGTVKLWDMQKGSTLKSWDAHRDGVTALDVTRTGQLVTAGRDRLVRLWNPDGKKVREFAALSELPTEVAFDSETSRAIAGDWSGKVSLWESETGALAGSLSSNPPPLAAQQLAAEKELETLTAELSRRNASTDATESNLEETETEPAAAATPAEEPSPRERKRAAKRARRQMDQKTPAGTPEEQTSPAEEDSDALAERVAAVRERLERIQALRARFSGTSATP